MLRISILFSIVIYSAPIFANIDCLLTENEANVRLQQELYDQKVKEGVEFPKSYPLRYLVEVSKMTAPTDSASGVGRYKMSPEKMQRLIATLEATMREAAEAGDPLAQGSVAHMSEHYELAQKYSGLLESLGINPLEYRLLATAHDIGKFVPNGEVLQVFSALTENPGLRGLYGRISGHDVSTRAYLDKVRSRLEITESEMNELIADIAGHNDGSGLRDVFWNQVAWPAKLMGEYGIPKRIMGNLLSFFDRYGQGNRVGAIKIYKQIGSEGISRSEITEAFVNNPSNTIRQLNRIAEIINHRVRNILRKDGFDMFAESAYTDAVHAQQSTIDAFNKISFFEKEGRTVAKVTGNGRVVEARTKQEFLAEDFQTALWAVD